MRRLTRFISTWMTVSRIHRYADSQTEWTEADRRALGNFLKTPAGAKMERLMVADDKNQRLLAAMLA